MSALILLKILRTSFRCEAADPVSTGDAVVERSLLACIHRLHSGTKSYQAKFAMSKSTVSDSDTNVVAGAASGDAAASAAASASCIEYVVIGGALRAPIEVHEKINTAFGSDWVSNICNYSCLFLNVLKQMFNKI